MKKRGKFAHCKHLLEMYRLGEQLIDVTFESNMLDIGNGIHSTAADIDAAMGKARKEHPLPEYEPILKCEISELPALAK